jgi:hypothetical protein
MKCMRRNKAPKIDRNGQKKSLRNDDDERQPTTALEDTEQYLLEVIMDSRVAALARF